MRRYSHRLKSMILILGYNFNPILKKTDLRFTTEVSKMEKLEFCLGGGTTQTVSIILISVVKINYIWNKSDIKNNQILIALLYDVTEMFIESILWLSLESDLLFLFFVLLILILFEKMLKNDIMNSWILFFVY